MTNTPSNPKSSPKLNSRLVLDLLDDQPGLKTNILDWTPDLRQAPLQAQVHTPTVSKTNTQSGQMPPSKPGPLVSPPPAVFASKATSNRNQASTPAGQRIFRDEKSLRQMMNEYNGRPLSTPIQRGRTLKVNRSDFAFDSVEQIRLAEVPGKILRPS